MTSPPAPRPWTRDGRPSVDPVPAPDLTEARRWMAAYHRTRLRLLWSWHGWPHVAMNVGESLLRPFVVLGRAVSHLIRSGAAVRAESGTSRVRQAWDLATLWVRSGMQAEEYSMHRLFLPGRMETADLHIPLWYNVELFAGLFGWLGNPFDKVEFAERCEAVGLPVIPTLAVCPWRGEPEVRRPDAPEWAGDLFSKSTRGGQGRSQRRWRRTPDGGYTSGRRTTASTEDLLRLLTTLGRRGRAQLLQPCITNHPDILEVTRGGVATLRLTTVQRSGGRTPEIIVPSLRLPVGDSHVDNISKGNIAAPVDLVTGRVGQGRRPSPDGIMRMVDVHPDSGRRIDSLVLPHWEEALELCIEGQRLFAEAPSLGWDVAITPDGPVLVEANIMWGPSELNYDIPLGLTPYPRWTVEWLREWREGGKDLTSADRRTPSLEAAP